MSPMGNQRNFSSPSLAKRTVLQNLKPQSSQDKPGYHQNIWSNPFGTLDEMGAAPPGQHDINYLQRLQAQQFPHIPNHKLKSLEELADPHDSRIEIYENPSEHYAAVKYEGTNVSQRSGSSSGSSNRFLHNPSPSPALNSDQAAVGTSMAANTVNFYGYGKPLLPNIYIQSAHESKK